MPRPTSAGRLQRAFFSYGTSTIPSRTATTARGRLGTNKRGIAHGRVCPAVRSRARASHIRRALERLDLQEKDTSAFQDLPITTAYPRPADARPPLVSDEILMAYSRGYSNMEETEYYLSPDMIEGELPLEITGTLLQNGPGLFNINGQSITHPNDGDGVICSLAIRDEMAFFRSRYVQTPLYKNQHRSAHDVQGPKGSWFFNPLDFTSKNPANKGVMYMGRRLYALHEAGLPYHLDARTLATLGTSTLGGSVEGEGPISSEYKVVTDADGSTRHINFGVSQIGMDAAVTIYEHDSRGVMQQKRFLTLPGAALGFIQDIAVTDNYYLLVENPCATDLQKLFRKHLIGQASAAECVFLDKERPAKIHIIPRNEGRDSIATLSASPFVSLKHINAFELDDGQRIVLDTMIWRDFDFSANLAATSGSALESSPSPVVARLEMDLAVGKVDGRILSHRTCHHSAVNPGYVGKPHTYSYLAGCSVDGPAGPPQVLMRIKADPMLGSTSSVGTTLWEPGANKFVGQPLFVPRGAAGDPEGSGWLMCMIYNAAEHKSQLAILDAADIADGPVCSIHFPHHMPHAFQSTFAPGAYLGPARTAPKGWIPNGTAPIR